MPLMRVFLAALALAVPLGACVATTDFDGLTDGTGAAAAVSCLSDEECDDDQSCTVDACVDGSCRRRAEADGLLPASEQHEGDCRQVACSDGELIELVDDDDLPTDENDCTEDQCWSGEPRHVDLAEGQLCGTDGGKLCDGAGTCVECNVASDCSGSDDECSWRTCEGHQCGVAHAPAGTQLVLQTTGDCHVLHCDGAGGWEELLDDSDLPEDFEDCTADLCSNGVSSNPPMPQGAACGAGTCNGVGQCVGCNIASDCGTSDECKTRSCTNSICGLVTAPQGTILAQQVPGDCKQRRCGLNGNIDEVAYDSDVFDDGEDCTTDSCSGGVSSHTAMANEAQCLPSTCSEGWQVDHLCDGGDCDSQAAQNCGAYQCAGNVCGISCQSDGDCALGYYCNNGSCDPKLTTGLACTIVAECASGFCVDGVCCAGPCVGDCVTCNASYKDPNLPYYPSGECGWVADGLDPDDDCTAQTTISCGLDGACGGLGQCRRWEFGTLCSEPSCFGETLTAPDTCDGQGACINNGQQSCGTYLCEGDNSTCRSSCISDSHCSTGNYCDGSQCVPKKPLGQPCGGNGECASTHCADAVCCNAVCGSCEICTKVLGALNDGECTNELAGQDPFTDCCSTQTCDGNGNCAGPPCPPPQ